MPIDKVHIAADRLVEIAAPMDPAMTSSVDRPFNVNPTTICALLAFAGQYSDVAGQGGRHERFATRANGTASRHVNCVRQITDSDRDLLRSFCSTGDQARAIASAVAATAFPCKCSNPPPLRVAWRMVIILTTAPISLWKERKTDAPHHVYL